MINGNDALEYTFQAGGARIMQTLRFEEMQACAAMGITWDEYVRLPGIDRWIEADNPTLSKAAVLAWFRYSKLVPAIVEDIAARKVKRR